MSYSILLKINEATHGQPFLAFMHVDSEQNMLNSASTKPKMI
ncbi:MAG: hypothetical protein ACKO7M_01300 [Acinetobacter junii]|nr:hypothetical protein [Acinetobacter junii]